MHINPVATYSLNLNAKKTRTKEKSTRKQALKSIQFENWSKFLMIKIISVFFTNEVIASSYIVLTSIGSLVIKIVKWRSQKYD